MADSGRLQVSEGPVFNIIVHTANTADETVTVLQGDSIENQTNIKDSYIRRMDASTAPGPDAGQISDVAQAAKSSSFQPRAEKTNRRRTDSPVKATYYAQEEDYRSSKRLLDEIKSLQNPHEVDILLLDVECDIYLRDKNVDESVSRLREVILESDDLSTEDIRQWAEQLVKNGREVAGILMYRISTDKRKYETADFNSLVFWIQNRMLDTRDPTRKLQDEGGKSHRIVSEHVVDWRVAILENLRAVSRANPVTKALCEARCACSIIYACPDQEQNVRIVKQGLEVLETQFRGNSCHHKVYSWPLNNIGCAYGRLGNYEAKKQYFSQAVRAAEKALDYARGEKEGCVAFFRRNLMLTCDKVAAE